MFREKEAKEQTKELEKRCGEMMKEYYTNELLQQKLSDGHLIVVLYGVTKVLYRIERELIELNKTLKKRSR